MRIQHRPRTRVPHAILALQEHHKGHYKNVMRPTVAQLMPPVLANDLALVDLLVAPQVAVALLVQEDGLEHVVLEGDVLGKLALVVRRVEAHLQLGDVGRVHLDVVHRAEVLLGVLDARRLLVLAGQRFHAGSVLGVEVLVVLLHVVCVRVRDGDVVGELRVAQNFALRPGGGLAEEAFGGVGEAAEYELIVVFFEGGGLGVAELGVVPVGFGRPVLERDDHAAGFGAVEDADEFGGETDCYTAGFEVFSPGAVELAEVGEDDHRRVVGDDAEFVVGVPHAVGW